MKVHIYDIECLPNFFSYCALDRDTDELIQAYVYRDDQDQIKGLLEVLQGITGQIGFNCLNYDSQIIEAIIRKHIQHDNFNDGCYELSKRLIKLDRNKGEYLPYFNTTIPQLDLFKIWHFDNVAKHTSLKKVEFNMRFENLEDLPFPHDYEVQPEDVQKLIDYNINDIKATKAFYLKSLDKVDLRKKLSKMYGLNLLNASDAKIGTEIILDLYCQYSGKNKKDVKDLRTWRNRIKLEGIVFGLFKEDNERVQETRVPASTG